MKAEFTGGLHIHPYELAHLHEGDIKGFGTHVRRRKNGRKRLEVTLWPNGVVPFLFDKNVAQNHSNIDMHTVFGIQQVILVKYKIK